MSVDHILKNVENRRLVLGIFIDLSKAFDTISHTKLLKKLQFYGVRGSCLDMMASYLNNRTQSTKFQGTESDEKTIEYGVA